MSCHGCIQTSWADQTGGTRFVTRASSADQSKPITTRLRARRTRTRNDDILSLQKLKMRIATHQTQQIVSHTGGGGVDKLFGHFQCFQIFLIFGKLNEKETPWKFISPKENIFCDFTECQLDSESARQTRLPCFCLAFCKFS